MSVADHSHLETFKYRVFLTVKCLHLAKNVSFNCKIIWKRHQSKAETKTAHHRDNTSVFNEELQLEFNIQRDTRSGLYLEKNVDLLPVIITEGGLKSGGLGRFDLAQPLNKLTKQDAITDKTVVLVKCPDPNGTIDISLRYQRLGAAQPVDEKADLSVIEPNLEVSRSEIKEVKENKQPRLSEIKKDVKEEISLTKVIESLERRVLEGKQREQRLTAQLQKQKQDMTSLQKALDKKSQDLLDKSKELANLKAHMDMCSKSTQMLSEKDETISKLQAKTEDYEKQIQELTVKMTSTSQFPDHVFQSGANLDNDELKRIGTDKNFAAVAQFQHQERLEELEQEKLELQTQLAISNNRLANIFNTAYETGGAKLLDLLQSSIIPS